MLSNRAVLKRYGKTNWYQVHKHTALFSLDFDRTKENRVLLAKRQIIETG